jgi:hypothetical protein
MASQRPFDQPSLAIGVGPLIDANELRACRAASPSVEGGLASTLIPIEPVAARTRSVAIAICAAVTMSQALKKDVAVVFDNEP